MSSTYSKAMDSAFRTLTLPSLASGCYFGTKLLENVSTYNVDQLITAGSAAAICGGAGLLGLYLRKNQSGLESALENNK